MRTLLGLIAVTTLAASASAMDGIVEYSRMVEHSGRSSTVLGSDPAQLVEVVATEPVVERRRVVGFRWTVRDVPAADATAKATTGPREFAFEVGRELPSYRTRGNLVVNVLPAAVKPGTRLAVVFGRGQQKDREGKLGPAVDKVFTETFFRPAKVDSDRPEKKSAS